MDLYEKYYKNISFGDMTVRFRASPNHPSREYLELIDSLGPLDMERFQISVVHH